MMHSFNLAQALVGAGVSLVVAGIVGLFLKGAFQVVRRELTTNGGKSVADSVRRTELQSALTAAQVDKLVDRFDKHLESHARQGG